VAQAAAVGGFQRLAQVSRSPSSLPDQGKAADHRTHLMMEETARFRRHDHMVRFTSHGEVPQRLHRAGGLALRRTERGEIVPSDQHLRRFVHGIRVKLVRDAPGPSCLQHQRRAAIGNDILVRPPETREPRVPVLADLHAIEHRDGLLRQPQPRT